MPRAGLTPAKVVEEAARLADEVGFENLTLAALAARFGVAVPSLYKHVDGLDAVRRGVAAYAVRQLGRALDEALRSAPQASPSARLDALARAYRGYALAHPGCYAATVRAAGPDDVELRAASEAVLGTVLGVLAERGLRGDAAIDATRTIRAALHGFLALETAGGFGLPRDVDRSFERLVAVLDAGLGVKGRTTERPIPAVAG